MTFASVRHRVAFEGGTVLLHKHWWRPAAFLLGRAARLAPNHWESHNNLAVASLKLQRWEDAARAAERAIALDPRAVDSRDFFGIALLQLERWDAAVIAYQEAIKIDPHRYDLYDRLGMALSRLERWEGVVATYEAALELDAARFEAYQRLGIALHRLRRWEAAAAAFRRAIELAQSDPSSMGEVAGLELGLASAEARRDIAEAVQQPPPPPIVSRFAQRQASFWSADNLGSDVFATERWIEALSVASEETAVSPGPSLMFVLDNDFGELTTLKYFLLGQQKLAGRTTLLLPDRLHVHNADAVPGRTHRYASVDDILVAVDRQQSDIVFLCSAYLFCPHLEFTLAALERLIDQLRLRGCKVVTTDPYLGMLSQKDAASLIRFEVSRMHAKKLAAVAHIPDAVEKMTQVQRALEEQAWAMLRRTEQILHDAYHLYPTYCDVTDADVADTDARNVAFFNDQLLRPASPGSSGTTRPHWLFILASADCDIQSVAEGDAFADIVASKLMETLAAGRHPILVAPEEFLAELMPRMPSADGIDMLSHCPFNRYMSLLLSAEHAFYWNAVSHSLLIRLFNRLPVALFDRGHLLRTAPAIHDRIVRWYYQGVEPPIRNHREPLTLDRVDGWAAEYRQRGAGVVDRFRRAPSPEEMIADLMARPHIPVLQSSLSYR